MNAPFNPPQSDTPMWQALNAARAEQDARRAAAEAALAAPDADYLAMRIEVFFKIEIEGHEEELESWHDPDAWNLADDAVENATKIAQIVEGAPVAISSWVAHYHSLGLLRADDRLCKMLGGLPDEEGSPCFYLVHEAKSAVLTPAALGEFGPVRITLAGYRGATITLTGYTRPINATALYEAASEGCSLGLWGGEAAPELAPREGEARDAWLRRVCLLHDRLARLIEGWRRSGGQPALFAAAGAASGEVAKRRPIEWVVPGLIPRGYVTLLVGTKQAGKSTLAGEVLAVVDSECEDVREVLGAVVAARGISCMVSGEDGIDFISSRNAYYEPVHGPGQGFAFDTAERPWPEVLALLFAIPSVAIIAIDGLRAVMPGNEDSSEAISQFFDDLNALARHHRCAIILVHHLSKGHVRSLSAMLPAVRGSGAITDRVRVAIGMIDRGAGVTEVGIIKHNIPPSEGLWGEVNVGRHFRRDASTLTLVPVEAPARGSDASPLAAGNLEAIVEAITYFNQLNVVLRQTGKRELFEQRSPHLAGLSRGAIRQSVSTLLAAGRISDGADGLRIVPAPAAEAGA